MAAPQVEEKDSKNKVGYVGRRLSMKQCKMLLASTPKHGAQSREMQKYWMGMRATAPVQTHAVEGKK